MLIIADESGKLPYAAAECNCVQDALEGMGRQVNVEVLRPSATSKMGLHTEIQNADVVHFAGEGYFDVEHPENSGWVVEWSDETPPEEWTVLRALEFGLMQRPPRIVFANACATARSEIRRGRDRTRYDSRGVGLAQAFLNAGVDQYVGTMWRIPDARPTTAFAESFYRAVLSGCTTGQSIRDARLATIREFGYGELAWASYVLFGDPTYRLIDLR